MAISDCPGSVLFLTENNDTVVWEIERSDGSKRAEDEKVEDERGVRAVIGGVCDTGWNYSVGVPRVIEWEKEGVATNVVADIAWGERGETVTRSRGADTGRTSWVTPTPSIPSINTQPGLD
eukprot:377088-Hanusia_phi.AAC.1